MTEKIRIRSFTEFRGKVPEVPIREGIDMDSLLNGDDDPFFLTLEIAQQGAVSTRKLLFDESLVDSIVTQVNSRGIEGIMGHLRDTDMDNAYPVSDIHWLGAMKDGDGKAWAKGYIPRTAVAQREHFRILKATNGKAATSIFGMARLEALDGGLQRAREFRLEQLDLAPFTRAALPPDSDFTITKEMNDMDGEDTTPGADGQATPPITPPADTGAVERIAQLESQVAEQAALLQNAVDEAFTVRIAELTQAPVTELKMEEEPSTALVTVLREMVGESSDATLEEDVSTAWEKLTPLVQLIIKAQAGPDAIIKSMDSRASGTPELEDTPETRAAARAKMGM